MRVIWSKRAREDLEEIANYIAQDKPQAAANWLRDVQDSAVLLSTFPSSGQVLEEKNDPSYRVLLIGMYRLIYRVTETSVEILLVHRTSRRLLISPIILTRDGSAVDLK